MDSPSKSATPNRVLPPSFVQIDRALRANDLMEAIRLARQALDAGHVDPVLFNLRAHWRKHNGQLEEALADLLRAYELESGSPKILCELADCLNALGRHRKALLAASDALGLDAGSAAAWYHKGFAHQMLNEVDLACQAYREAVRRNGDHAEAHARLAGLQAGQGRHAAARAHADRALAVKPGHPLAILAHVTADLAERRFEAAECRLVALLAGTQADPQTKAIATTQLADLRDAQGRTQKAFDAYAAAAVTWQAVCERRAAPRRAETAYQQLCRVMSFLDAAPALH